MTRSIHESKPQHSCAPTDKGLFEFYDTAAGREVYSAQQERLTELDTADQSDRYSIQSDGSTTATRRYSRSEVLDVFSHSFEDQSELEDDDYSAAPSQQSAGSDMGWLADQMEGVVISHAGDPSPDVEAVSHGFTHPNNLPLSSSEVERQDGSNYNDGAYLSDSYASSTSGFDRSTSGDGALGSITHTGAMGSSWVYGNQSENDMDKPFPKRSLTNSLVASESALSAMFKPNDQAEETRLHAAGAESTLADTVQR